MAKAPDNNVDSKTADRQQVFESFMQNEPADSESIMMNPVIAPVAADNPEVAIEEQSQSVEDELVSGSKWLSIGNIVSRILGAVYIIPWTMMLGHWSLRANGLFTMSYVIYAIFLAISTAGIPVAISNLVAKYNSMNEAALSLKLLRYALRLSIWLGLGSAIVMYFGAYLIAGSNQDLRPVLQSLTFAVLIFPMMSMLRGYFQGRSMMKIVANSQIVEQLVRIIYMLVATYLVIKSDPNNWTGAVWQTTFAAFVGGLAGLLMLGGGYLKHRSEFQREASYSAYAIQVDRRQLFGEIVHQSVPVIIVASIVNIYQFVDQSTFYGILHWFDVSLTHATADVMLARFNANANKIIMIVISFATAIASTAMPMLSRIHAQHDQAGEKRQWMNVLNLFSLIVLPASIGLYVVAEPIYVLFYGTTDPNQSLAINMLQFSSIMGIFISLFTVLAMALQGVERQRVSLRAFTIGLVAKLVTQVPLVMWFKDMGPLISSVIGFGVSLAVIFNFMAKHYHLDFNAFGQTTSKVMVLSLVMGAVTWLTVWGLEQIVPMTRLAQGGVTVIAVIVGVVVAVIMLRRLKLGYILGNSFPSWLTGE